MEEEEPINRIIAGKREGFWRLDLEGGIPLDPNDDTIQDYTQGNYVKGKKDGAWFTFRDGELASEKTYRNGIINQRDWYYPDGSLKLRSLFDDGELSLVTAWYEDGQIRAIMRYKGVRNLHGESIRYWPNGTVQTVGRFKDDKKNGYWRGYMENGALEGQGEFVNDLKQGLWYIAGELLEDNIVRLEWYENGEIVNVEEMNIGLVEFEPQTL